MHRYQETWSPQKTCSSALYGRKDAEEEAAACGQSRSKAKVLQKTGRLRDLHHTLSSEEVNKGLTGCKDLWVSHCTSQDAPVMRKLNKRLCALAPGLTHTHGVL